LEKLSFFLEIFVCMTAYSVGGESLSPFRSILVEIGAGEVNSLRIVNELELGLLL
jgi:hypothetical protein